MTRDEREVMKALSKEVFGTTSRWQKIMRSGEKTKVMSKRREDKGGEEIEVSYYAIPTVEQVKTVLETKAKEMAAEKELKESKDVGPTESSPTDGPVASATPSGTEGGAV